LLNWILWIFLNLVNIIEHVDNLLKPANITLSNWAPPCTSKDLYKNDVVGILYLCKRNPRCEQFFDPMNSFWIPWIHFSMT
jgi:hypothetical protein